MDKAIEIVESKLQMVQDIIESLSDTGSELFFIPRKLILQDVLKELKSANKK